MTLGSSSELLDIGSGYGKSTLIAAMISGGAAVWGVEHAEGRVEMSQSVLQKFESFDWAAQVLPQISSISEVFVSKFDTQHKLSPLAPRCGTPCRISRKYLIEHSKISPTSLRSTTSSLRRLCRHLRAV
jgi:hypothetical protein